MHPLPTMLQRVGSRWMLGRQADSVTSGINVNVNPRQARSQLIALVSRFGGSAALYRSSRGLSPWIMFEPDDGAAAWMTFGRKWTPKEGVPFLSNAYSKLARRFGLELPLDYPIASGEQPIIVVEKIVTDLQRSLPIVLLRISMNDLIAVENEEPTGATASCMKRFGANYAASVDISDFSENRNDP